MAFDNKKFRVENSLNDGMGVGPHDYVVHTYNANNKITGSTYYVGGAQASGTVVAVLVYGYDGNNNVTTLERTT